jgi:hypothetical protein
LFCNDEKNDAVAPTVVASPAKSVSPNAIATSDELGSAMLDNRADFEVWTAAQRPIALRGPQQQQNAAQQPRGAANAISDDVAGHR